jgi:hypothetical protein
MSEGVGARSSRLLGELILIFLGITAALWFENANEARHQRQLETQILGEMATALTRDTADLHINLVLSDSVLASIDTVLARMQGSAPYRDDLADEFAWAGRFYRFFNNPAAYEHLRSAGFDVISNDALRQAIISYYDGTVPTLRWVEETILLGHWETYVVPQMMAKFEYQGPWAPAVPRDYSALRRDVPFRNALRSTAELVRNQGDLTRRTLALADSLSLGIAVELEGR